jgi:hypothetical protein
LGFNQKNFCVLKPLAAKALQLLVSSLQSNETATVKLSLDCSNEKDAEIRCSCDNSNEACSVTEMYVLDLIINQFVINKIKQ